LPLPRHIPSFEVLEAIHPDKDVDGLGSYNLGKLFVGHQNLVPCTPLACLDLIKQVRTDLRGLRAVIVGRSCLVGKPLGQLLLEENCTVTQAHSYTKDLPAVCREADILVSAVGRPNLITAEYIKSGAIVIDVGINRMPDGRICGDVDFESVAEVAGAITPVPGGVGPMTVCMLLQNVVKVSV
jgi:methylenetetrahydrofolate dehydrogenase (NADP+)/methenyltetrahydrofolate cyclohydrolase